MGIFPYERYTFDDCTVTSCTLSFASIFSPFSLFFHTHTYTRIEELSTENSIISFDKALLISRKKRIFPGGDISPHISAPARRIIKSFDLNDIFHNLLDTFCLAYTMHESSRLQPPAFNYGDARKSYATGNYRAAESNKGHSPRAERAQARSMMISLRNMYIRHHYFFKLLIVRISSRRNNIIFTRG